MNHRTVVLLSALTGAFLASPAPAAEPLPGTEAALQAQLDAEEAALRPQRQALLGHFRQAYARYPSIPAGTLEAIAFVQSRWMHLEPDAAEMQGERHHHIPAAHGPMGLYDGDGFAEQVTAGARLIGTSPEQVRTDPRANVLAAAALLDQEIRRDAAGDTRRLAARTPESIRPALMRYAGYSASPVEAAASTAIGQYARTSFAYDVLLAQDRGVDDRGIKVPERPIQWEKAFDMEQLIQLRAPFVRLDVANDRIETADYRIDPVTETLEAKRAGVAPTAAGDGPDVGPQSTDYGPARWVASPYHSARSSYSSVTIHTAQGSYGGTISWFQNNPYRVSAHYVIRSSDGQVTQMVRESRAGHHVGVHNGTTLGIEHEGYVNNSSWYTTAMYNSSAALVRHFCARYADINCANAYSGAAHSGVVVLPTWLDVKGHQHYSSQTHTDPGINWNWGRYFNLLNPGGGGGGGGGTTILDSFEGSVGHFNTSPTYSGSTTGISTASSATRNCTIRRNGNCSLRVLLRDDPRSSSSWAVRLLSGAGNPGSNVALNRASGRIGFWVFAAGSGMQVGVGIDDSDGTERSVRRSLPANQWTYVSWSLADAGQWNAWVGGNGAITGGTVKLDAVWLYRAQTSYDVNVYIDDVQVNY